MGATLDTGGRLALTRQGLSPCKMHQASTWRSNVKLSGVFFFGSFCAILHKKNQRKIGPLKRDVIINVVVTTHEQHANS